MYKGEGVTVWKITNPWCQGNKIEKSQEVRASWEYWQTHNPKSYPIKSTKASLKTLANKDLKKYYLKMWLGYISIPWQIYLRASTFFASLAAWITHKEHEHMQILHYSSRMWEHFSQLRQNPVAKSDDHNSHMQPQYSRGSIMLHRTHLIAT